MTAPFSGPEFVMGSFVSYRVFRIIRDLNTMKVRLSPLAHSNTIYSPGEWYTASCSRIPIINMTNVHNYCQRRWAATLSNVEIIDLLYINDSPMLVVKLHDRLFGKPEKRVISLEDSYFSNLKLIAKHKTPKEACSCGFYSYYLNEHFTRHAATVDPRYTVVAAVENAGRVLHGTNGIRSERMRILGIRTMDWQEAWRHSPAIRFYAQRSVMFRGYPMTFEAEHDPLSAELDSESAVQEALKRDGWDVLPWDTLVKKYAPSPVDFLQS